MSLPHILLGLLRKQPQTGYELQKQLETTVSYFWTTDISRVYRTLGEMGMQGWVTFEAAIRSDSLNRKVYSLTEAGRRELERWLAEPGKSSGERNAFLAQLHFSDAIPIEAQLAVLEERLAGLRVEAAELERRAARLQMPVPLPRDALRAGLKREMFSLEYGIRRYRFEIGWLEDTIAVLRNAY